MLYIFSLWDFQLMVKLSCRYCKSYGNVNNWLCDWTNLSRFGGSLPSLNVYIGLLEYTQVKLKYSQLCMCAENIWLFLSTTTIIHTSFQFALRANLAYQIRHKVGLIARKNTSLAAPGALAHRLQRRNAFKIKNGRQWAPKWPTGSGKGRTPWFFGRSCQLSQHRFFLS